MTLWCENISMRYGETQVLHDVSLRLEPGEIHALLGPSGCGKTTLLRLFAGLARPTAGTLGAGETTFASDSLFIPPEARRVGLVFQDHALFPHLTVAQNVAFGLAKGADHSVVNEMLALVQLDGLGDRPIDALSGGQQQRVAIARALAPKPAVVLLDEPFSHLDAQLRRDMRRELASLLQAVGATALVVTHDQQEAFALGHRVTVLLKGRLQQTETPEVVYQAPANEAVAHFVGEANVVSGAADGATATCALGTLALRSPHHGPVRVLIRPEQLHLVPTPDGTAHVTQVVFEGERSVAQVAVGAEVLTAQTSHPLQQGPHRLEVSGPVIAWPEQSPKENS